MDLDQRPLVANVDSRNGVGRIALLGELDLATVPLLTGDLARLEADGVDTIMLDVRDVTFADASALHAFLEARDRAATNGHRFLIVGVTPRMQRLFELTGTQHLFDEREMAPLLDRFMAERDGDLREGAFRGSDRRV